MNALRLLAVIGCLQLAAGYYLPGTYPQGELPPVGCTGNSDSLAAPQRTPQALDRPPLRPPCALQNSWSEM